MVKATKTNRDDLAKICMTELRSAAVSLGMRINEYGRNKYISITYNLPNEEEMLEREIVKISSTGLLTEYKSILYKGIAEQNKIAKETNNRLKLDSIIQYEDNVNEVIDDYYERLASRNIEFIKQSITDSVIVKFSHFHNNVIQDKLNSAYMSGDQNEVNRVGKELRKEISNARDTGKIKIEELVFEYIDLVKIPDNANDDSIVGSLL